VPAGAGHDARGVAVRSVRHRTLAGPTGYECRALEAESAYKQ
jgi:hypothetical protein